MRVRRSVVVGLGGACVDGRWALLMADHYHGHHHRIRLDQRTSNHQRTHTRLSIYYQVGRHNEALQIFGLMRQPGAAAPNTFAYNLAMEAHVLRGEVRFCIFLCLHMYVWAIRSFHGMGDSDARERHQHTHPHHHPPPTHNNKQDARAVALFDAMNTQRQTTDPALRPDPDTCLVALRPLARAGRFDDGLALVEEVLGSPQGAYVSRYPLALLVLEAVRAGDGARVAGRVVGMLEVGFRFGVLEGLECVSPGRLVACRSPPP